MVQTPSDPVTPHTHQPSLGSPVIVPTAKPPRDNAADEWWSDEPQLETELHRAQIDLLLRLIKWHWRGQRMYCSGNTTVYFDPENRTNRNFRGPDVYVVFNADPRLRKSWMVWREGNQFPNVVFGILSDATAKRDRTTKKQIYQDVWQLSNYFWFHPYTQEFQGFRLVQGQYQALQPNERGHLWSEEMGLFVGMHTDGMLRLFTPAGELVLLEEEEERSRRDLVQRQLQTERQRAEAERQRADQLAERLRQLGIDPDAIQ
ncbi:MAG: Uma2 family endonuclease [Cyanothece sp. SIO2G6]|nr:Uma2 family endonuclease [Cyanothece sp. SIO2G6]